MRDLLGGDGTHNTFIIGGVRVGVAHPDELIGPQLRKLLERDHGGDRRGTWGRTASTAPSLTGRTGGQSGAFVRPFRSGRTALRGSRVSAGTTSSATNQPAKEPADPPDPRVDLRARESRLGEVRLTSTEGLWPELAGLPVAVPPPHDPERQADH